MIIFDPFISRHAMSLFEFFTIVRVLAKNNSKNINCSGIHSRFDYTYTHSPTRLRIFYISLIPARPIFF